MVAKYAYASTGYGQFPYAGNAPQQITPSRSLLGIPFITANDRYQVVVCEDPGTAFSPPKFRYWYANAPLWDADLQGDTAYPTYHSLDENNNPVLGELQLPARTFEYVLRARQFIGNAIVHAIMVDFVPRPVALHESLAASTEIGFSGYVVGYGVTDYTRPTGGGIDSGMAKSDPFTFTSTVGSQASDVWPNVRSVFLPIRFKQRVRSFRAILTDIRLVEIRRVTLIGELGGIRET